MFDPRTLPNGDLAFNLAAWFWWAAMVADILVTRWGVWYYGFAEGNFLTRWFVSKAHPERTFFDAALRMGLVVIFLTACGKLGIVNKPHSWIPLALTAATVGLVIRNVLLIRKNRKAAQAPK